MNPLLKQWTTPRETPPFNEIKKEHWLPAFEEAIAEAKKDIQAIVGNEAAPDFGNTVVALDRAGDRLSTVAERDKYTYVFDITMCAFHNDADDLTAAVRTE
ncbi:MAG: hypothetical protein IKN32_06990, partial [Bacteroidales bacterium]|nr:hypothetical protein [Bacteroidales bacterium]